MLKFNLIRKSRRRTITIRISRANEISVIAPKLLPEKRVRELIEEKSAWIQKQLQYNLKHQSDFVPLWKPEEMGPQKALELISERVGFYQEKMPKRPLGILVKALKSSWGNCSLQGKIVFNWRIALAPLAILDYVVVHELAHLVYHNHSKNFWAEVAKVLPSYKECRKWLRLHGHRLKLD